MSQHPELNSKIRLMSALAPISYVEHMSSPIALIAPFCNEIEVKPVLGICYVIIQTFN